MHPNLAPHLHTDECNKLIAELQECHTRQRLWQPLLCNKLDKLVWDCLQREREGRRKANVVYQNKNKEQTNSVTN